jgi:hypothetical protein
MINHLKVFQSMDSFQPAETKAGDDDTKQPVMLSRAYSTIEQESQL